jgi:glycosyltransferase involved in cell wall biosynthesis
MGSKRILIAADYPIFPQRIGGMDRFFWAFDQALQTEGYQVNWLFPETADASHYVSKGFEGRMYFLPKEPKEVFTQQLGTVLTNIGSVDLLITHFVAYNTAYSGQWKKLGAKKLMAVDHMSRPMRPKSGSYRWRHFLKGLVNYWYVDRIIAVSGFVKASIQREMGAWWNHKIGVIYNGVDMTLFNTNTNAAQEYRQDKPLQLFTIAYLIEEKGIQDLISALKLIPLEYQWELTIAGNGPYQAKLESLTQSTEQASRIKFIGNITNQYEYLTNSDIVVIPSLWYEACPFTVIEAITCGACLLASKIGGITELARNGQVAELFEPGNIQELTQKLQGLMNNPQQRNQLREAAKEWATVMFGLENMVANHMEEVKLQLK